jgi:type I restriction enzyme S subunit
MFKAWQATTLGDCADLLSGGTPSKNNPEYWNGDIPWVSAKDMKSFRLFNSQDHVTGIGVDNGTRVVEPGTILVLIRGMTLHNHVPICIAMRAMAFNQDVRAVHAKAHVDPSFLAYWLLGKREKLLRLVDAASHGTGRIHSRDLQSLPGILPTLAEQKAIAVVLGKLDDKIELNRRMSNTLESLARTIFRSWFVDFEPVRAKMEGCQPAGMDAMTAVLFPASFEDSVIGKIPKGWRTGGLDEVVDLNPKRQLLKGEVAPFLEMKNMPTHGHRPALWAERAFTSGPRFSNGDTLLARITPCLENGKTAFVDFLEDEEVGWGSTEYIVLRPLPPLPPIYGYFLARNEDFRAYAIQNMTGTSGRQRVSTDSIAKYVVTVPTEAILKAFSHLVEPMMQLIRANSIQSGTLAKIRDSLLPKLISGELRLQVLGKTIEEIADG